MNIFRQEYDEGIEIIMPHRPKLHPDRDDYERNAQGLIKDYDSDGNLQFHTVRVRSIGFGYVIKSGKLPSLLQGTVTKTLLKLGLGDEPDANDTVDEMDDLELLNAIDDYQRWVIGEMLVSPKIVKNPKKDDEISYEMLSNDDKAFFIDLLDQPITNLRTFPPNTSARLAIVSKRESNEVPADTEPVSQSS